MNIKSLKNNKLSIMVTLLVLSLSILSCVDEYERNLQIMTDVSKQKLMDYAFKNNSKLEIFEFKALKYDTINQNLLDSFTLNKLALQHKYYLDIIKSSLELAKLKSNQAYLLNQIDSKQLAKMNLEDSNKEIEKAQLYNDSLKMIELKDSIIRNDISNRTNPELFFKYKFFIKATSITGTESSNILDTIYFVFDKDLKSIEL